MGNFLGWLVFAGLVGACWAFWGLRGLLVLTWLAGLVGFVGLAGACWACLDMLGLLDFLILSWLSGFAGPAGGHWGVLSLVKAALRTLAEDLGCFGLVWAAFWAGWCLLMLAGLAFCFAGVCWAVWGLQGLLVLTGVAGLVGLAGACLASLDMLGLLDSLLLIWLAGLAGGHWAVLSLLYAALRTLAEDLG